MYQEKNPAKNTGFFPRYSAPKRHSSLFLHTFLCRNTHVPPPPGPARPRPPSRPGPPSRSGPLQPAPAQRSGTFSFAGSAKATRPPKSSSPPSSAMPVPARPARVLAGPGAASEPHQQAPQGAGGLVARAGPQRCTSREASSESVFACKAGVGVTRPNGPSRAPVSTPRRQGAFSAAPSRLQSTATVDPNSFPHAVERAAGAPTPTASVMANREGRCALRLFAPLGAPFSVPSAAAGAPRAGSGAPTRRSASKSLRYAAPQLVKEACKSCS